MEPSIIISLSEYNEMKAIKEKFVKAFDEKQVITYRDTVMSRYGDLRYNRYSIVNLDGITKDALAEIERLNSENFALKNELSESRGKEKKRRSFFCWR